MYSWSSITRYAMSICIMRCLQCVHLVPFRSEFSVSLDCGNIQSFIYSHISAHVFQDTQSWSQTILDTSIMIPNKEQLWKQEWIFWLQYTLRTQCQNRDFQIFYLITILILLINYILIFKSPWETWHLDGRLHD